MGKSKLNVAIDSFLNGMTQVFFALLIGVILLGAGIFLSFLSPFLVVFGIVSNKTLEDLCDAVKILFENDEDRKERARKDCPEYPHK